MSGVISFIIGLFCIALMVTIHETGHFIVARLTGISVEVFAIGWGKAIKRWHAHGTEYRINIFPLGGYCRLKGAEDIQRSLDAHKTTFSHVDAGSLFSVPPIKRIPTFLAGSCFNILFALVLFIPFLMLDYESYVEPNKIVVSSDYPQVFGSEEGFLSAAARSGLQSGDIVLSVGSNQISDFGTLQNILSTRPEDEPTLFVIERNGEIKEISIIPDYDVQQGRVVFGVSSYIEPVVAAIKPSSPESFTPMQEGDLIVRIQGDDTPHTIAVIQALQNNPDRIFLTVRHKNGIEESFHYNPEKDENGNSVLNISFRRPVKLVEGLSFGNALINACKETSSAVYETIVLIPSLIMRDKGESRQTVVGPLRISYIIGEMRNAGVRSLLHVLSIVSISLAVANLLPIPGLDGGSILLSLIEFFRRKPVSPKLYVKFQTLGLFFLLLLMFLVMFSDISFFLVR